jgi:hypothetical protein
MAGGLGRLALDAGSAELYYRTRLFSPGAAEQFFGAGERRFGQDLTILGNAFTGGAGQPLAYRVGYTFGNVAQIATMFSKLGEARTLAEVGTVAELADEARAARTMSDAALLRGAGAEGQPAAALFQELEVACKKPPVGVAQMEARAQLAQKLESEAAAELKATAQAAEADVATAELVQSEFPFTQENLSGRLASSDATAQSAGKGAEQLEFGFVQNVERQTLARNFYRSTTSWSDSDIWSHMRGIDFEQPVTIEQIPDGTQLIQYKFPNRPTGNYFAYPGTPALGLGIDPAGRISAPYTSMQDLQALQSTAADTRPFLNVPPWARGPGGRKQLFIPNTGGVTLN